MLNRHAERGRGTRACGRRAGLRLEQRSAQPPRSLDFARDDGALMLNRHAERSRGTWACGRCAGLWREQRAAQPPRSLDYARDDGANDGANGGPH